MKIFIASLCLILILGFGITARADVRVNGYFRSNGTYVQPHYRSNPDGNFNNNWSSSGNINPHTGSLGYRNQNAISLPSLHLVPPIPTSSPHYLYQR